MKYPTDKFYSCYSPALKDYLENFGFEPDHTFKHIHTGKTCWVFEKSEVLTLHLGNWTKNKELMKQDS